MQRSTTAKPSVPTNVGPVVIVDRDRLERRQLWSCRPVLQPHRRVTDITRRQNGGNVSGFYSQASFDLGVPPFMRRFVLSDLCSIRLNTTSAGGDRRRDRSCLVVAAICFWPGACCFCITYGFGFCFRLGDGRVSCDQSEGGSRGLEGYQRSLWCPYAIWPRPSDRSPFLA